MVTPDNVFREDEYYYYCHHPSEGIVRISKESGKRVRMGADVDVRPTEHEYSWLMRKSFEVMKDQLEQKDDSGNYTASPQLHNSIAKLARDTDSVVSTTQAKKEKGASDLEALLRRRREVRLQRHPELAPDAPNENPWKKGHSDD